MKGWGGGPRRDLAKNKACGAWGNMNGAIIGLGPTLGQGSNLIVERKLGPNSSIDVELLRGSWASLERNDNGSECLEWTNLERNDNGPEGLKGAIKEGNNRPTLLCQISTSKVLGQMKHHV